MATPYPFNTKRWKIGDVVLHMYDSKHPKMFMRVIGYTRDGLCKTRYIPNELRPHSRAIFKNEIGYLLDPTDFGMNGTEDPVEYERVRLENFYRSRQYDGKDRV